MRVRFDRLVPFGVGLVLVGVVVFLLTRLPPWWNPAHALGVCSGSGQQVVQCKGYNLFSGELSDVSELSIIIGMISIAVGWWVAHNCHIPGCLRLEWHPHPNHGHPVCKRHHPHSNPEHPVWMVDDD